MDKMFLRQKWVKMFHEHRPGHCLCSFTDVTDTERDNAGSQARPAYVGSECHLMSWGLPICMFSEEKSD